MLNDSKFNVTYLRSATAYGLSNCIRLDLVVNNLTCSAFTTKQVKLLSDGTSWRPLVHVDDMSNAFISVLKSPTDKINGETFNVGSNEEISIKNLAELIKKLFDSEININIKNNKISGQSSNRNYYVPNISKALGKLNLKLNFSLANSIKKILSTQNTVF